MGNSFTSLFGKQVNQKHINMPYLWLFHNLGQEGYTDYHESFEKLPRAKQVELANKVREIMLKPADAIERPLTEA